MMNGLLLCKQFRTRQPEEVCDYKKECKRLWVERNESVCVPFDIEHAEQIVKEFKLLINGIKKWGE